MIAKELLSQYEVRIRIQAQATGCAGRKDGLSQRKVRIKEGAPCELRDGKHMGNIFFALGLF